jgi:ubiquinone/menaquinone biosynthesis C-methylase UbiE
MTAGSTTYPEWDKPVVDWDEKPEPAAIWQIVGGYSLYWTLVAALKLSLFDQLEESPQTLETLADRLSADRERLAHICDTLVSVWILDGDRAGYRLNKTSRTLLVSTSERYMGDIVMNSPGEIDNWPALHNTIRSLEPPQDIDADGGAFYERFAQSSYLTQLRGARFLVPRLGFHQTTSLRILDLGAGGAPWTVALLEAAPESSAVVNELTAVLPAAEKNCRQHDLLDRCEFVASDYHQLDLEPESFDLVVMGHILRNEGPELGEALLARSHRALRPGGRVLVADYFVADDHLGPPQALLLGITMIANTKRGMTYRKTDMAEWMTTAGFEHIRSLETVKNNHVLIGEKSTTS